MCLLLLVNGSKLLSIKNGLGVAVLGVLASTAIVWSISILHDFYLNFFIKFFFVQIYIAAVYICFKSAVVGCSELRKACQVLIFIHAAFFLFQVGYFLATGDFIDLNNYVREVESESLYMTKALEGRAIGIRGVGLFSEPSFYAMAVLPAAAVLLAIDRRITVPIIIALGTATLSLSIAAIFVVALLGTVFLVACKGSRWVKVAILAAALAASPFLFEFYNLRVTESVDYDAISSRQSVFEEFKQREWNADVFGAGFFWDETSRVGVTGLWGYHVRDSSFLVYLYFASGVLGCGLFATILARIFRGCFVELLFFLPLLLFKFHILFGLLWFTLASFYQICLWRRVAEREHAPEMMRVAGRHKK